MHKIESNFHMLLFQGVDGSQCCQLSLAAQMVRNLTEGIRTAYADKVLSQLFSGLACTLHPCQGHMMHVHAKSGGCFCNLHIFHLASEISGVFAICMSTRFFTAAFTGNITYVKNLAYTMIYV